VEPIFGTGFRISGVFEAHRCRPQVRRFRKERLMFYEPIFGTGFRISGVLDLSLVRVPAIAALPVCRIS
jgi:hypothetical protein